MAQLLAYIAAALQIAAQVQGLAGPVVAIIANIQRVIASGGPTEADWNALDAQTIKDQDALDADANAKS